MSLEHWWSDIEGGRHFIHHTSHMDWLGINLALYTEANDLLPEPRHGLHNVSLDMIRTICWMGTDILEEPAASVIFL